MAMIPVLVTPPPILVKMDIVKPNTVWHVKKAIYGLREAPRLWQQERDQKLRDLEFMYIMISLPTLFKATSIQAYGSLQKALGFLLKGFLHSIMLCEATSGQLNCMTIAF